MPQPTDIESSYVWCRLLASVLLMTVAGVGMYAIMVVLPSIQLEFGVDRGAASLPFTLIMIGFGFGGIFMGRLSDRFGIVVPVVIAAFSLCLGFVLTAQATTLWQFALIQGVLIGFFGVSATFAPLLADISHWFLRRRGLAVAICACGNYFAGAIWPPVIQRFLEAVGWRTTFVGVGIFILVAMLPLSLILRRRLLPGVPALVTPAQARSEAMPLGMSPNQVTGLLFIAGLGCCVAMSMPQVHMVALCSDLGFGPARGAEMLSLMLGLGVISRLVFGLIADKIGGLRTLLLGSTMQCFALLLFLPADGLVSLYLVSGLFGLFQGGIVPTYALIIREHFPAVEAGRRVGIVIMATLFGMAFGGWISGAIYDWTGSYTAAFVNGVGWNLLNVSIVCFLLWQQRRGWEADARRGEHTGHPA
ncbi:MAG: MFS transporter [Gammaproteobacteria bacterium]|nr:MFS transporter [Gammaproteobacteria bacterium]